MFRVASLFPGNSGVLLRVTGDPPSFLAKCVEAQLKHGDAGDIWAFYGFEVAGAKDRFVDIEHDVLGRLKGVRKIKDAARNRPASGTSTSSPSRATNSTWSSTVRK